MSVFARLPVLLQLVYSVSRSAQSQHFHLLTMSLHLEPSVCPIQAFTRCTVGYYEWQPAHHRHLLCPVQYGIRELTDLRPFDNDFLFLLICMSVFGYVHMSTGAHGGQETMLGLWSWSFRWATLHGCWELNWSFLEKRQVLSTTESPLQPLTLAFLLFCIKSQ